MNAADAWDEKPGPGGGPDFEPIVPLRQPKPRSRLRYVAVAILILVAGGAGAWYLWGSSLTMDPDAEIPLVRADAGPIKVRPESPGGMDVPDRDKLVYDRIDGNGERPEVERLLPPPEMPQPLPAPAEQTTEQPEAETAADSEATETGKLPDAGSEAEAAPPPPVPPAAEPGPTVAEVLSTMRPPPPPEGSEGEVAETPPATVETPPAKPKAEAKAAESIVARTPAGGGYRVQLAAVRTRDGVDGEWKRLQKKNPDLLGSLDLAVERADLGPGKGVFYRLQAGPLASETAARGLCEQLKSRKIGCLVVRPEG